MGITAFEGKHLFIHDVRQLPDAACDQFSRFEDRGANLFIGKPVHDLPYRRLNILPGRRPGLLSTLERRRLRQNVEGAPDVLESGLHVSVFKDQGVTVLGLGIKT